MSRPIGMATPTVEELEAEIERLQKLYDVAVADRVRMHSECDEHAAAYRHCSEERAKLQAVVDDEIEDLNRVITDERTAKIAWRSISANQEIEIERLRKVIESLRKGNEETKI